MDVLKGSEGGQHEVVTAEDLALIHAQSRKKLSAEEIYTFSVRLCDNELDRDLDRFSKKTLEELAELFVGKSGIFDHSWTATGQACRIYRTEVVMESLDDPLGVGEGTYYLKGYAYMVHTESNQDLIAEIDAGIKREVSVGCGVAHALCSICGEEIATCPHSKGEFYEDKRCYASLEDATDAYEFSFVAVPAQPKAGVMKGLNPMDLFRGMMAGDESYQRWLDSEELQKTTVWDSVYGIHPPGEIPETAEFSFPETQLKGLDLAELGVLKEKISVILAQAKLGRACLAELQGEVKRLAFLCEESFSGELLDSLVKKLDMEELQAMKTLFEEKSKYPIATQLDYGKKEGSGVDGAFLI